MSFNNTNDNTEFGRDTGRTGGDYDNNSGSTGFGNTQSDQFNSSNTSSGYGRDSYNNTDSSSYNSGSTNTDSSYHTGSNNTGSSGSSQRTDNFASNTSGGQFGSGRSQFNDNSMEHRGKVPMGEKVKGGAEKFAGKMMGKPGLQERGQERKMGEFENNDF